MTALVYPDANNSGKFILKLSCVETWNEIIFDEEVEEHYGSITEKIETNIYRLDV